MKIIPSRESGVVFCPTCGNLLLVRVEGMAVAGSSSGGAGGGGSSATQFYCRTCPYVYNLGTSGEFKRLAVTREFGRKTMDDVLGGEDAWKDVAKTDARCVAENCNSKMAYFRQMQIRSADEPMTTFYRCVQCARQWKED